MKTLFFLLLGIFFTIHGIWYTVTSNFDFGDFVVWCIAVLCFLYAFFHRQIDDFTTTRVGFGCKIVVLIGCVVCVGILAAILWGQFGKKVTGTEAVMIVLGCAVQGDAPSLVLQYRLDAAYEYYQSSPEVIIVVSGGQGSGETVAEAVVMQQYLIQKGIPEAQILVEAQSSSTEENFKFSKQLLEANGYEITQQTEMVYVTNGFHCMRAGLYAKNEGFENANALAAGIPITQIITCYLREIFAVAYYIVFKSPNTGFLKDYVGILHLSGKR